MGRLPAEDLCRYFDLWLLEVSVPESLDGDGEGTILSFPIPFSLWFPRRHSAQLPHFLTRWRGQSIGEWGVWPPVGHGLWRP